MCDLTTDNAAKKNKKYFRSVCKPCRSKLVTQYNTGNKKRQAYMRTYIRKIGKVKQYPCEYCKKLCYKKYAIAFCSDKCRLMSYILVVDGCWIWQGGKNRGGYGKTSLNGHKHITAHRASYIIFKGEIPKNICVCHRCDNPLCIFPDHLWLATSAENTADMVLKGRSLMGEKHNKAKLSKKDVLRIRYLNTLKKYTQNKIGELFNISAGHVNNIVKKRVWRQI